MTESPEQAAVTPETIALAVLGWILGDGPRAERLLSLTGLTPDVLRDRLGDPGVQAAVLEFILNHEPDLLSAADALQLTPEKIVSAYQTLCS